MNPELLAILELAAYFGFLFVAGLVAIRFEIKGLSSRVASEDARRGTSGTSDTLKNDSLTTVV